MDSPSDKKKKTKKSKAKKDVAGAKENTPEKTYQDFQTSFPSSGADVAPEAEVSEKPKSSANPKSRRMSILNNELTSKPSTGSIEATRVDPSKAPSSAVAAVSSFFL